MPFSTPLPLSLYIHIPWCLRKCPYCDFNSHQSDGCPDAFGYVRAVLADLELELSLAAGRRVETLFIGGGTPSLLPPEAIETLLHGVARRIALAPDAEVTMEANPGALEMDRFAGYRQAGINRLSLGVQSFNDDALSKLGRIHNAEQAVRAIEAAKGAGFKSINLDLMFGLPGQDMSEAVVDLEQAILLAPDHLSYYQLTIEPNTLFYNQPPVLPEDDLLLDIQDAGQQALFEAGYSQYEVSAYARDGQQCRHNLNYWRFGDYIGVGAGAHGKLTDIDRQQVWRRWRVRHPQDYLDMAGNPEAISGQQLLEVEDLVGEFMLNALRLNEGFDLSVFEQRTGLSREEVVPRLEQAVERELLVWEEGQVIPTARGRLFLNDLIATFL